MEVVLLKLSNGEEFIGQLSKMPEPDEYSEYTELYKPCRHIITGQGPMIVPYPCENISVPEEHIMFYHPVIKEVVDVYTKMTTEVIIPPNNGNIILPKVTRHG